MLTFVVANFSAMFELVLSWTETKFLSNLTGRYNYVDNWWEITRVIWDDLKIIVGSWSHDAVTDYVK